MEYKIRLIAGEETRKYLSRMPERKIIAGEGAIEELVEERPYGFRRD